MKIKTLDVMSPFNYLWLKSINGVDLSVHCAKCLLGEYDDRINLEDKHYENLDLKDSVYYLCGVAKPYNWNNNFHLAFMPCDGEDLIFSDKGIVIIVEGAKRLPILQENIDFTHEKAHLKAYYTCRNWQFAHYLNANQELL